MKDKYIIINRTVLEKRIEELKTISNQTATSVYDVDVEGFILEELEQILSKSIPLIPEIENAFREGSRYGGYDKDYVAGDYIENLKLDI